MVYKALMPTKRTCLSCSPHTLKTQRSYAGRPLFAVQMSTLSEYCPTCEAKITTSLRYHKRMIHQVSVGVKYPNQAETDLATILFRGTDTFFRCRFCVYYSSDPSQLQVSLFLLFNENCTLTVTPEPRIEAMRHVRCASVCFFHRRYRHRPIIF